MICASAWTPEQRTLRWKGWSVEREIGGCQERLLRIQSIQEDPGWTDDIRRGREDPQDRVTDDRSRAFRITSLLCICLRAVEAERGGGQDDIAFPPEEIPGQRVASTSCSPSPRSRTCTPDRTSARLQGCDVPCTARRGAETRESSLAGECGFLRDVQIPLTETLRDDGRTDRGHGSHEESQPGFQTLLVPTAEELGRCTFVTCLRDPERRSIRVQERDLELIPFPEWEACDLFPITLPGEDPKLSRIRLSSSSAAAAAAPRWATSGAVRRGTMGAAAWEQGDVGFRPQLRFPACEEWILAQPSCALLDCVVVLRTLECIQ